MTLQHRITYRAMSVALFVAAFVFFAFFYRGHLYYNEQYQLFLFSSSYFLDLLRFPGGLAAWLSRFLIQFFLYPAVGGLIYACAISGVRFLCSRLAVERTFLSDMASFIPALLLWAVMCKEYVQITPAVCVLICLGCACLCRRSRQASSLFLVLTPVLYWACGLSAVVFVAASLSTRKWWVTLSSLAIILAIPFAVRPFVRLDIVRLYTGFFYLKNPSANPVWPWLGFAGSAAFAALFSFKLRENVPAAFCTAVAAIAGGVVAVALLADFRLDEEMVYSNMARNEKWDDMIAKAGRRTPMSKYSVANLNLALAMKGRLGDDMFKFVQTGTDCLVPTYELTSTDNLVLSDIFYHISLVSPSQHHMFECKECIRDFDKGSRMYQRLAQTNSINGRYAISGKYLDALSKTLFYRKWATEFDHSSEDFLRCRALGYHSEDFLFSNENILNELALLCKDSPENYVAFQYAVAYALLERNLDMFKAITSMKSFARVPRSYQEAFLLVWMRTHTDLNGLPRFMSTSVTSRFVKFVEANNKGISMSEMKRRFGDTYWFYYYCVGKEK